MAHIQPQILLRDSGAYAKHPEALIREVPHILFLVVPEFLGKGMNTLILMAQFPANQRSPLLGFAQGLSEQFVVEFLSVIVLPVQ